MPPVRPYCVKKAGGKKSLQSHGWTFEGRHCGREIERILEENSSNGNRRRAVCSLPCPWLAQDGQQLLDFCLVCCAWGQQQVSLGSYDSKCGHKKHGNARNPFTIGSPKALIPLTSKTRKRRSMSSPKKFSTRNRFSCVYRNAITSRIGQRRSSMRKFFHPTLIPSTLILFITQRDQE